MLHKMGSFTGSARKVSPPTPTYMTEDQKSSYLSNLRNNRPVRPTGSRPPPFKPTAIAAPGSLARSDSAPVIQSQPQPGEGDEGSSPHPGMTKSSSFSPSISHKGRPLAQGPDTYVPSVRGRKFSPTATVYQLETPSEANRDSTARKLEKEEAHTLREALHIIDRRSEEKQLYEAAQMEAADLVWKHRNPQAAEDEKNAAYVNPELQTKKNYGPDLAQTKHQSSRAISDGSTSSQGSGATGPSKRTSRTKDRVLSNALKELHLASEERSAAIIAAANAERRRSSGNRVTSNGSAKGIFRNPEDQIYEEPGSLEDSTATQDQAELPLKSRPRNSLPRGSRPLPDKPGVVFANFTPRINHFEIHKNPPTQSKSAAYATNTPLPKQDVIEEVDTPKSNTTLEIRGEDIRAATTMKRKDRSPKLPTPVVVSDQPGRPIVSFDPTWKPSSDSPPNSQDVSRPVIKLTESPRMSTDFERPVPRPVPSINEPVNSAPVVPTINLPHDDTDIPKISVEVESGPTISVSAPFEPSTGQSPSQPAPRPLPKHSSTMPAKLPSSKSSRLPWLNGGTSAVPTVACSACSLPISGRIVTASGSSSASSSLRARFHPECFSCHHCSTPLECVSFYPEPDSKRAERLEAEDILPDSPEANFDIRFYCHLDFHELFSPRCRSCKTPIEGQVIVAAGGEYHVGHFFCAECGDPFDSETPFVEHNGYAYCVRCHTRRTSARCRECKQQILDELTVEALGGKWHERCFCCWECGGGFGEEGRFFVREVNVDLTEKERRKGISRKVEERAVCESCEERRLKA